MQTDINNETLSTLLGELGITEDISPELEKLAAAESKFLKDLRININNTLKAETLSRKEAYILAYSIGVNENNSILKKAFESLAISEGATSADINEAIACVSLMNTNNTYYRFKHFANKEFYNKAQAGIRMSIMMNPVLGKEFFELLSLVISAVNGCEMCVTSHEESVLRHGGSQERILDAVRLGSVIKGFSAIYQ